MRERQLSTYTCVSALRSVKLRSCSEKVKLEASGVVLGIIRPHDKAMKASSRIAVLGIKNFIRKYISAVISIITLHQILTSLQFTLENEAKLLEQSLVGLAWLNLQLFRLKFYALAKNSLPDTLIK